MVETGEAKKVEAAAVVNMIIVAKVGISIRENEERVAG